MSGPQRRLAAILFSDLAGYTAQMGRDESRAIAAVQRSRREQRALVERYGRCSSGPAATTAKQ